MTSIINLILVSAAYVGSKQNKKIYDGVMSVMRNMRVNFWDFLAWPIFMIIGLTGFVFDGLIWFVVFGLGLFGFTVRVLDL